MQQLCRRPLAVSRVHFDRHPGPDKHNIWHIAKIIMNTKAINTLVLQVGGVQRNHSCCSNDSTCNSQSDTTMLLTLTQ